MLFLSSFVMLSCTSVFDALWSPAGKGLTLWLSFVMSNCDVVTLPMESWVRCGACLLRFLIFALFLTLMSRSQFKAIELTLEFCVHSISNLPLKEFSLW